MDRQTDRQTDRHTDTQTHRRARAQTQTGKQANKTDRQRDRQTIPKDKTEGQDRAVGQSASPAVRLLAGNTAASDPHRSGAMHLTLATASRYAQGPVVAEHSRAPATSMGAAAAAVRPFLSSSLQELTELVRTGLLENLAASNANTRRQRNTCRAGRLTTIAACGGC